MLGTKIILHLVQFAALAVAIYYRKHLKFTAQKYFVWFLIYVVITEVFGLILPLHFDLKNSALYNVYIIISGYFYLHWFYSILKQKKMIKILALIFTVSIIVSALNEDFYNALWKVALITIAGIILICTTMYYSNLLNDIKIVNFNNEPQFWISTGLLIFYLGFLPLLLLQVNYFKTILSEFRVAIVVLNIIMYGCFTIGFLCTKQKK